MMVGFNFNLSAIIINFDLISDDDDDDDDKTLSSFYNNSPGLV